MAKTCTRLGLDIGTNSIGWVLYELANGMPVRLLDGGVRIFSDGRDAKTGASLAVDRRSARGMRKRRDRYLRRRAKLMRQMAEAGLMPADPVAAKALEALDPFELRARGLDRRLDLTELGRALFHLNQRRGFKSNRKADAGDNEGGKISDASARLDQEMMVTGARTYGEFLHKRRVAATDARAVPAVRTRLTLRHDGEKEVAGYDFYPDRRHLEEEFDQLWAAQARHHDGLTDELREAVRETIFYQRPLRAPKVGRCLFLPEERLPKAHPLNQRRVLHETVNALKVRAPGAHPRPITRDERDAIITALDGKKFAKSPGANTLSFAALAKVVKLRKGEGFTLDTAARDGIACDLTRAALAHPDRFGPRWLSLPVETQIELVDRLRSEQDAEALHRWLMETHALDAGHARETAAAPLPEGFARLGLTATTRLLEKLREGLIYSDAVAALGWNHSDRGTGEVRDELPYYGEILDRHVIPGTQDPADDDVTRYGRITNPTVHIGLNQLRRLVNKIIAVYGRPDQIVVELARELKQGEDQRLEAQRTIARNRKAAEARSEKLVELGLHDSGANRAALRLWEDMNPDPLRRFCPYTGKLISVSMLFSGECDVDHILPYSRTLDDSMANRTWCLKESNRDKRNLSPHEAWGHTPRWPEIQARLAEMPEFRRWRFQPDAMARYEGERDFIDRALVDTQYLSRIAREYLEALYPRTDDDRARHVWVVPGRLTEMLRRHWGLNALLHDDLRDVTKPKNRMDHRHHMIDAAVIGATDHKLIKAMADQAQINAGQGLEATASHVPAPWPEFRDDMDALVQRITVSHRADHGRIDPQARQRGQDSTTGRLHNDTAYGLADGDGRVVTRKPLDSLTSAMIPKIRDDDLRAALEAATAGKTDKDFKTAVAAFAAKPGPYRGIRRVRIIEPLHVIEIRDRNGKAYKGYKGDSNQCYEVWQMPGGEVVHQVISTFDAHQATDTRPHPAARRLLRLFKDDMVKLDDSKFGPVIVTVEKFNVNGQISMVPQHQGNADHRYRQAKEDLYVRMQPSALIKAGARRIIVDEMGRWRDPGPRRLG